MAQEKKEFDFDTYSVFDNDIKKVIIHEAKYPDIEDYLDNPKYSVVWNMNGMTL